MISFTYHILSLVLSVVGCRLRTLEFDENSEEDTKEEISIEVEK